jgi:hypothetical protein
MGTRTHEPRHGSIPINGEDRQARTDTRYAHGRVRVSNERFKGRSKPVYPVRMFPQKTLNCACSYATRHINGVGLEHFRTVSVAHLHNELVSFRVLV